MVLLVFPGTAKEINAKKIYQRYGTIFKAFGDRVTFVILANHVKVNDHNAEYEFAAEFEKALAASHLSPTHHVVVLGTAHIPEQGGDPSIAHSYWAQDPFVVMCDENGQIVLLEPMFHTHTENSLLAEQLASSANILLKPTRYRIEGGNILVGDDFALIGKSILEVNRLRFFAHLPIEEGQNAVTAELKRVLGLKYILWVGFDSPTTMPFGIFQDNEKHQHIFHIDLFITLGGKDKNSGDEIIFIPKPTIDDTIFVGNDQANWKEDFDQLTKVFNDLADVFRLNHETTPGPRFKVERIPMGIEVSSKGIATLYSYNNAHVEWYHGIKRIYLPHYPKFNSTDKPVQDRARRRLEGLGYRVAFIDSSFDAYTKYGRGSLHCLSKVLMRENY
jgi:hypothetical protein